MSLFTGLYRLAGFHLENCPMGGREGATGGIWFLRRGMVIKDVTKFHNAIWGLRICLNVCVCVCRVYRILSFWEGENSKVQC